MKVKKVYDWRINANKWVVVEMYGRTKGSTIYVGKDEADARAWLACLTGR